MAVHFQHHRLDDEHDPIVHDVGSIEAARPGIVRRSLSHVATLDPEDAARYCEHGSYVGFQRALAFKCPMCRENGVQ